MTSASNIFRQRVGYSLSGICTEVHQDSTQFIGSVPASPVKTVDQTYKTQNVSSPSSPKTKRNHPLQSIDSPTKTSQHLNLDLQVATFPADNAGTQLTKDEKEESPVYSPDILSPGLALPTSRMGPWPAHDSARQSSLQNNDLGIIASAMVIKSDSDGSLRSPLDRFVTAEDGPAERIERLQRQ